MKTPKLKAMANHELQPGDPVIMMDGRQGKFVGPAPKFNPPLWSPEIGDWIDVGSDEESKNV
jgi:hypothetical protein